MNYGKMNIAVHGLLSSLSRIFTIEKPLVDIRPDYTGKPLAADISFTAQIKPIVLIKDLLPVIPLIRRTLKDKNNSQDNAQDNKGDNKDEQREQH
jgi:hypothetical protein